MNKPKKYLLIVNPAAGSGKTMKALPQIERILHQKKVNYEFHFTEEPMHATDLVRELGSKFDVVVSVGGDGTINEVINGVPEFKIPFGMIPIGTGNDFARSCCIPYNSIEAAIDILLENDVKNIDVGEINGRKFVNVVGLGFEGRANEVGKKLTLIRGPVKYLLAIAYTLITYKRKTIHLKLDDLEMNKEAYLISIGNGWNVGGGLQLTPKAKLDDGLFDVCFIENITRRKIITNFNRLTNGTIAEIDEVTLYQSKTLQINSDYMIPLHVDGESLKGDRYRIDIKIHEQMQPVIGNWKGDKRFDG